MDNNKVWIKSLIIDGKAISLKGQQFDMGLALVEKDEDIVTQDVLMQLVGHDAAQAIKRFSHIDARLAQEVPRIGIKG